MRIPSRIVAGLVFALAAGIPALAQPAPSSFARLAFEQSYVPASRDTEGHFLGGTETMRLVAHGGRLFTGLGSWMDVPYLENKPTGSWTGAKVVVKESAAAPWRVEVSFGTTYGPTEALAELTLTTDAFGNPLVPPVTLLVAGPSEWNPAGVRRATAWVRDDVSGSGSFYRIASEPGGPCGT